MALFRPTSVQIGSLTWNYALKEHHNVQRLLCEKPDKLAVEAYGMHLPLQPITLPANGYSRAARTVLGPLTALITAKQDVIQQESVDNAGTTVVLDCAISISRLFPELMDSFPDGYIYVGNG